MTKNKKVVIISILSLCILLILSIVLFLIINDYRYTKPFDNKELFPEAEELYEDNQKYFDLAAEAFEDKYDSFSNSNENDMIWGEYYIMGEKTYMCDETEGTIHYYNTETADQYFDFTDEQIEAFHHISKDLDIFCIFYFLWNDGRYYLYFNVGSETVDVLFHPTYYVDYGLSYSSDGKSVSSSEGKVNGWYYNRNEQLSNPKWFKGYHCSGGI